MLALKLVTIIILLLCSLSDIKTMQFPWYYPIFIVASACMVHYHRPWFTTIDVYAFITLTALSAMMLLLNFWAIGDVALIVASALTLNRNGMVVLLLASFIQHYLSTLIMTGRIADADTNVDTEHMRHIPFVPAITIAYIVAAII